jgi:ACS family allantoate permease-like MFS transporter
MDEVWLCTLCMELRLLKLHVSSLNIFIWGVALCCHAACKNFAGLFVVRLILGMCEGSITAGFLIVSSMFYTRKEQTARVGYWCKDRD